MTKVSLGLCAALILAMPSAAAQAPDAGRFDGIGIIDPAFSFAKAGLSLQITYTTTDQHGASAPASGALYVPQGLPPQGGWPLMVWAHGTIGIGDGCAPSRHPQLERYNNYFNTILDSGYAVLAPDYQGLGTGGNFSYYNAAVEGDSILDMVAAVRTLPIPLSHKWVLVGQSEGAHAAMSATGRYRGDGPAAGLSGVSVTGLRTNPAKSLPEMFRHGSTGAVNQVGYAGYYLASLQELHPDRVAPYLSDFGRDYVEKAATECLSDLVARAGGRRPEALVIDPSRPTPTFADDLRELTRYRDDNLPVDVQIGYGTADIDVPPADTPGYGKDLQERNPGVRVTVNRYEGKDHREAFVASLPDTLAFLRSHL